jgi:hypothetical protein
MWGWLVILAALASTGCALVDAATNGESGDACLDGVDNDGDDRTDCEDSDCRSGALCNAGFLAMSGETCNGADDASMLATGLVDELACSCLDDSGCDDLNTGAITFFCNTRLQGNNSRFVCTPDCREVNYCAALGASCAADGFCGS